MSSNDRAAPHSRPSPRIARHGPTSPSPALTLSLEHISDALQRSPDNGATIDLAHKHIVDIPEPIAEELFALGRNKSPSAKSASLARIALGHNRLTTLPVAFSLLSRLRYLNLKSNNFTVFPEVLTAMPSLEVLDLSRNKIRRFPAQAGSLTSLRVFSLSKNKVTRLPTYMMDFHNLRIFKMDQNPVDWPPRFIMEPDGDLDNSQFMEGWIKVVQTWINDNLQPSPQSSEDSTLSEQKLKTTPPPVSHLSTNDDHIFSTSPVRHSRSASNESDISTYSAIEASLRFSGVGSVAIKSIKPDRPPRLNLSPFSGYTSPPRSPSSPINYLPTPDDSVSSAEEDTAKGSSVRPVAQQQQHIRNASYAGANLKRPILTSKKSLPDLRLTKSSSLPGGDPIHQPQSQDPPVNNRRNGRSKTSPRHDSVFSGEASSSRTVTMSDAPPTASPTIMDRPAPAPPIDVERNSYFRRLSTLPSSTISKAIPQSLLTLVDAARGILFAVSQVYQTLQYYTVYAIDERLSAVLLKVLDPASDYMIQLINALDRFDATSRRMLPSPTVCRAVVENCRDTVAVFGKAMGVLALQLKVLATRDDVRYTRQMLLVLYGATAEISNAWHTILPQIDEVEPLLRERPPPASIKHQPSTGLQVHIPHLPPILAPALTPVPLVPAPRPLWRSHSAQPAVESERTRMMRRHAGSFSSKDVQIGKMLPSFVDPPNSGGVVVPSASIPPTPRLTFRQAASTPNGASPSAGVAASFRRSWGNHSRHGSQSSILASSSNSSASSSPSVPSRTAIHETPLTSSTLLDNDAIDAMQVAVDVAPVVWEAMDTIMEDVEGVGIDLLEGLKNAKALTQRLTSNIRAVKEADPTADRKALRDDATVFAKTVISLCNIFKTHGANHPLPPVLRANMIALTNATEESVMLLHVSSFSLSNAIRPYSPMVNGFTSPSGLPNVEDGRLEASLTRNRSNLNPISATTTGTSQTVLLFQAPKMPQLPRKAVGGRDVGDETNELHL